MLLLHGAIPRVLLLGQTIIRGTIVLSSAWRTLDSLASIASYLNQRGNGIGRFRRNHWSKTSRVSGKGSFPWWILQRGFKIQRRKAIRINFFRSFCLQSSSGHLFQFLNSKTVSELVRIVHVRMVSGKAIWIPSTVGRIVVHHFVSLVNILVSYAIMHSISPVIIIALPIL